MKIRTIALPSDVGQEPFIEALSFDSEVLTVRFDPDTGGQRFNISFTRPRGFRCLDEGDLLRYWEHDAIVGSTLVEILDGGWLTDESHGHLDLSAHAQFREFLIMDTDTCITVLALSPPEISIADGATKTVEPTGTSSSP